MKKRLKTPCKAYMREIIFQPAIMPMEAAVIPAKEPRRYGALSMVPHAYEAATVRKNQRAKIWVR